VNEVWTTSGSYAGQWNPINEDNLDTAMKVQWLGGDERAVATWVGRLARGRLEPSTWFEVGDE